MIVFDCPSCERRHGVDSEKDKKDIQENGFTCTCGRKIPWPEILAITL
jgi:hypothetical protein